MCIFACRPIRASSQAASPRVTSACASASRWAAGTVAACASSSAFAFTAGILIIVDVAHALRVVDEQDQVGPAFALE